MTRDLAGACSVPALLLSILLLSGCGSRKGDITISSDPAGARIFLDESPVGTTPQTLSGLLPGKHVVELRKEGYARAFKQVALLEGQTLDVNLRLEQTTGLLLADSVPQGVDVVIDGVSKGATPLRLTDLPLGRYELEFRSPTHLPRTMEAELSSRKPVLVLAELVSTAATIEVASTPGGAEVRINGISQGATPVTVADVLAGEAEVKVSKTGYKTFSRRMKLEATGSYRINAELEALPAGLTVITTPAGADVMVDRKPVGVSPVTLDNLKGGEHEIQVALNGYDSQTKTVALEPDARESAEFDLVKNSGTLVLDTEPANVKIFVDGRLLATTQPKGGSDVISRPEHILLNAGTEHKIQLVREGYASTIIALQTELDQVVTRHEILKRIFVRDTMITTDKEVIKCRLEYKLPNGNIYYERYPGVFDTAKASEIRDVRPIKLSDESNREARRLMELNRKVVPEE